LRFLLSLKLDPKSSEERQATHLFLLGDIFDLWFGSQDFYRQKFAPIVDAILEIKKQGIEVVYFEGNHDLHVIEFWNSLGIQCYVEDQYFNLGPWVLRASHGDLINDEDRAYDRYRRVVRSGPVEWLAHNFPAAWLESIGKAASQFSRKNSIIKRRDTAEDMRRMIRDYAFDKYKEKAFDYIVTGHMHIKDDWVTEINGKTLRSVNLGSWFPSASAWWLTEKDCGWEDIF
jgi:UDP-2,3-diacylglucosamine hydrolase